MEEEFKIDLLRRMPKVELHLHLEGAIQPATAIDLMRRNGAGHVPATSDELERLYRFEDLSQFVIALRSVSNHIQRLEDLQRITRELLDSLVSQNVRYLEFDCAVQKYLDLGFTLEEILDTLQSCTREAESQIVARLVINLQRSHGAQKTADLVERIAALDHPLVAGIGLSGDEFRFPQCDYRRAFDLAREAGLHRTVHAGEALGPESVRDALDLLHAERIDHGTRAIEDPRLVDRLKEERIPLTQCLSSNLRLNIVPRLSSHPFPLFLRQGLVVALHTDDPQVFRVTLTDEYQLAQSGFGLSREEIRRIVLNGVQGSFLPQGPKEELRKRVTAEWEQL
ncbi:MAG TPA: adenosine deaminase [bacterium]|nr:adenosine deaminase [bacterium]HOZ22118.1 adenosine deaminase [bacterium]